MKLQYLRTFCLMVFLLPSILMAQDNNFSDFKTTQAEGKAPAIFTTSFNDKVAESIEKNSTIEEKNKEVYAKYSNYALNNLLKSGMVLYGDPMTKYVEKVSQILLKNEPRLRRDLQFYVMKNNTTNALYTEPGIIFITTGLLSQIENEAQLAYVLSHEIVHHQKKHLQKTFTKSKEDELNPTSTYEELVSFSQNHEFEADKNALQLYHSAGYSKKEVNTVFDVLMYSYLSFDEIDFDSTFFGNPKIYIPQSLFPENANPILASEDYNDTKSSHPNIRKRKEAISNEIENYTDWGNNTSFIDDSEFKTIRNIARFESVRENLLNKNYIKALYEIYILEKEFPNNTFLQTKKAVAWASINQTSISGRKSDLTKGMENTEGSISILYGLFDNLNQIELSLLSLRKIEDIYQKIPSSRQISELRKETIQSLTKLRNLKIDDLESISFREAQQIKYRLKADTNEVQIEQTVNEDESKYDRIRKTRKQQSGNEKIKNDLSDKNFSLFLLYDLITNADFLEIYQSEKGKYSRTKVIRYNSNRVSDSDKNMENSDIILVTPLLKAEYKSKFDLDATLKFHEYLNVGIEKFAPKDRLKNNDISLAHEFTTEKYNQAAVINSYLMQTINTINSTKKSLWIDYEEMNNLVSKYNDPYLLLISGYYYYNKFIDKSVTGEAKYIQISTGEIYKSRDYDSRYKLGRLPVEGFTHLIFTKFK